MAIYAQYHYHATFISLGFNDGGKMDIVILLEESIYCINE